MTYNYNNSLLGDYLTPSGNYLVVENPIVIQSGSVNNTIIGNSVASSGNFSSLTVNSTGVSLIGHTHSSSNITDFNSSVSGLLPVKDVSAGDNISVSSLSGVYTVSATGLQPSGNYSLVGHSHMSSDITDFNSSVSGLLPVKDVSAGDNISVSSLSGVYTVSATGLQPSGNYSLVGHSHMSSDITDFNSSVSGLLPVKDVSAGDNISVSSLSGVYTVSATGLQPSGNYSLVGHSHMSSDITDFNSSVSGLLPVKDVSAGDNISVSSLSGVYTVSATGLQPSGNYSLVGHSHMSSDITDFNSSVSGLLPVKDVSAGDNISVSSLSGVYTVSATGLQPSGNYSLVGHSHMSSDITDFNSSVSGLLPVKDVSAGDNISVSSLSGVYTVSATGLQPSGNYSLVGHSHMSSDITDFNSSVSGLLPVKDVSAGDNISVSSLSGVYTVSATGLQPSGNYSLVGHSHMSSDITDFNSSVSGLLPVKNIIGSGNINVSNSNGSFTISSSGVTISNEANNRIITSDGLGGIVAESNLTFDGNLLSVSGNLIAISGTYNQLVFNTSLPDTDLSQGQLQWNNSEGTLDLGFTDTYSQHMGEELHYRVRNNTASTLVKGTVVYASGLTPGGNNRIEIAPFTADGSVREVRFMGLVTEDISNGVNGYTTQFGYIRGIDTRGDASSNGYIGKLWDAGEPSWSEGDILYAHPTVAGKLTKVEPKHSISVAIILNRHQNQGKIFVRPTSYGHLEDNHDVDVSGATNGQFLQYNSSTDYWVPSSSGNFSTLFVNGTGVSVSGHTHTASNITDFNTSVSGLLPTISNSGDNRILTSTGTSTGINAESNLVFDTNDTTVIGSPGTSLKIIHQQPIVSDFGESCWLKLITYSRDSSSSAPRIQLENYRGTEASPLPIENNDTLGVIRWSVPNSSGVSQNSARIIVLSQGSASGVNSLVPTVMILNTSSGPNQHDNSVYLDSKNQFVADGTVIIGGKGLNGILQTTPDQFVKRESLTAFATPSGLVGSESEYHNVGAGLFFTRPYSPNVNHRMHYVGGYNAVHMNIPSGVVNSGAVYGSNSDALRNTIGSNLPGFYDDNGTLNFLVGKNISYGHDLGVINNPLYPNPSGVVNPTTNYAVGLQILRHMGHGTLGRTIDISLNDDVSAVSGVANEAYGIFQFNSRPNIFNGSVTINDGLSSPTKIFSLGTVSGNVSVSYGIDKQIQTLTLNGTTTNFIKGSWLTGSFSADVLLEITVNSTTTVSFALVDDWYNPVPSFTPGKYLVLLRSMGSTIQGHYIGNKTN